MSSIRLKHASGNSMSLAAPGTNPASNLELKLPHTIGSANQLLKVDGSGQLGWATDSTTDSTKLPLAGGTLTGNLTAVKYLSSKSSGAALSFADSVEINLGTGDDLKLWHQTGNSYITSTGANLTLRAAGHLYLQDIDGNTMADFNDGGAVELYHNGNKAAATASDDFDVYRRLRIKSARDMSGDGMFLGSWDGSNHRIEADSSRPIFITAYNSSGIKFGYQSGEKVRIDNSGLKIVLGGYLDFYSGRTTYRHTGSVGEFKNNTGDLYCAAAGNLKFYTDTSFSTERLRIKTDGNIEASGNLKTNNLPGNNLIHNGEFAIWQRGTASIYSSQNKYLTDRFKFVSNSEGNGAVTQHLNVPTVAQTGGSKFAYSLRLNCTTADTSLANNQYINLSTRIEGQDLRHFGFGETGTRYATLSFWQRSASGTYHVSFRNSAYNRYYIASYTAGSNTWEKHELTIPVDTTGTWTTNNSAGVDITWSLGGGSWYNQGTVGSWQGGSSHAGSSQKNFFDSTSNDFYITGVQFEKGSIATPFEHKSYGEDLRHCQRYFYRAAEGASKALGLGVNYTASEMHCAITFPVTMRATPTLSSASGTNYYEFIRNGAADWFNSFALGNRTTNKIGEIYNQSEISGTVGHGGYVRTDNAAVYVDFVSEL